MFSFLISLFIIILVRSLGGFKSLLRSTAKEGAIDNKTTRSTRKERRSASKEKKKTVSDYDTECTEFFLVARDQSGTSMI